MESNKLDYTNVIADLEAKIAALQSLAASFRAAQASGALGQSGDIPLSQGGLSSAEPIELPVGALLNKSIPAAVKMLLSAVKRKMTNKDIASALREHGVESTSDNFEGVVSGAIKRLGDAGELLRFKEGWALAGLYPEHLRNRISGQEKKPARKKAKAKRAKAKKNNKPAEPVIVVSPEGLGLEGRIEKILKSEPTKAFAAADIAKTLNANPMAVSLALGRMAVKEKAEKMPGKLYQAHTGKVKEMKAS